MQLSAAAQPAATLKSSLITTTHIFFRNDAAEPYHAARTRAGRQNKIIRDPKIMQRLILSQNIKHCVHTYKHVEICLFFAPPVDFIRISSKRTSISAYILAWHTSVLSVINKNMLHTYKYVEICVVFYTTCRFHQPESCSSQVS